MCLLLCAFNCTDVHEHERALLNYILDNKMTLLPFLYPVVPTGYKR